LNTELKRKSEELKAQIRRAHMKETTTVQVEAGQAFVRKVQGCFYKKKCGF
jgi:hypothetical protein